MTDMEQMLFDYLDGVLDEDAEARVEAMISEDRQVRTAFSRVCLLHYGFRESLRRDDLQLMLQTPAGTAATMNELLFMESHGEPLAPEPEPEPETEPPVVDEAHERELLAKNWREALIINVTLMAGIAALLVVAIFRGGPAPVETPDPPIARVTRLIDAQWSSNTGPLKRGAALDAGVYQLTHGAVQLGLSTGVTVIVEAPTTFELIDSEHINLPFGRLSARVETPVDQFVVNTPKATLIDLGTVFAVNVEDNGMTDMAVFEGRVMVAPEHRAVGDETAWVPIDSGAAASVDEVGSEVVVQATQDERHAALCARSWEEALHRPRITGDVIYDDQRPASFVDEPSYDARRARIYPEKLDFTLPCDLPIVTRMTTHNPGQRGLNVDKGSVPKGTRVNCYLLHALRPENDVDQKLQGLARDRELNMTLHFRRPVLGLIVDGESLSATDELMGLEEGPDLGLRGLEGNESISLSPDRLTLTVKLYLADKPDQFRIIVEAPAEKSDVVGNLPVVE